MRIKVLNEKCKPLIENNGNFIDLRCAKTIEYKKGDFLLIPLGVCIDVGQGCFGMLIPRSSTFKNWGFIQTNSVGIIDDSYSGDNDEWMLPVYCTRDGIINEGDRCCQFQVFDEPYNMIQVVKQLGGTDRGGFGTTGK